VAVKNYYKYSYRKTNLEFLTGQLESSDLLGTKVKGAADKGAPKSGLLKSMYGTVSTYINLDDYNSHKFIPHKRAF